MHFTTRKYGIAKKINRVLLEKVQYLLSKASLDKSFWAEPLVYASHLINRLSSIAIGGKTLLDIWSYRAAQDYSLLRIFGYPIYFGVKDDKLNLQEKNICVFGCQKKFEGLQLWDSEN